MRRTYHFAVKPAPASHVEVGKTYILTLDLPNLDGQHFHDGLAAHNGQEVLVTYAYKTGYRIQAPDGWIGEAYADELKPCTQPEHSNG